MSEKRQSLRRDALLEEWKDHLQCIALRSFGPTGRVVPFSGHSHLELMIFWEQPLLGRSFLQTQSSVLVTIDRDAVDEYAKASLGQKLMADARLGWHLTDRLARLTTEQHMAFVQADAPWHRWWIGPLTLLG